MIEHAVSRGGRQRPTLWPWVVAAAVILFGVPASGDQQAPASGASEAAVAAGDERPNAWSWT